MIGFRNPCNKYKIPVTLLITYFTFIVFYRLYFAYFNELIQIYDFSALLKIF